MGFSGATTYSSYDALPPPLSVPAEPKYVVGRSGPSSTIILDYKASETNQSSPITGYLATCIGGGRNINGSAYGTSITVGGVVAGVEYSCSVQGQTNGGYGKPSDAVSVVAK